MKKLFGLLLASIILGMIFWLSPGRVATTATSLATNSKWTFTLSNGHSISPSSPGTDLSDLSARGVGCCVGHYRAEIPAIAQSHTLPHLDRPFMFIPAIGGTVHSITINGTLVPFAGTAFSSVGPLFPLPTTLEKGKQLSLEIQLSSPPSTFSGLWHSAPYVGTFSELDELRQNQLFHQRYVPLINSAVLIILCATFFVIYLKTHKRFPFYSLFSLCLLSWSLFYLFLSGVPRDWHFQIASLLHYPVRSIAGLGTYALVTSYMFLASERDGGDVSRSKFRIGLFVAFTIIMAQIALGFTEHVTSQAVLFALTSPLPFAPLAWWRIRGRFRSLGFLGFALSCVAFLGQVFDSCKLLDGILYSGFPLPYSNRYTFPLLLGTSSGIFIAHFSGFFDSLSIHISRLRSINRSALNLALNDLREEGAGAFAADLRRAMRVRRCSIAELSAQGRYQVIGVDGVPEEAIGEVIDIKDWPEIQASIATNEVVIGQAKPPQLHRFTTASFVAVPVEVQGTVQYIILLADRLDGKDFDNSDIPYLNQFSLMLRQNQERLHAQSLQIEAETRFRKVVANLDPHLYKFVIEKVGNTSTPETSTHELRAVGFFDQVNFVSTIESLDEIRGAEFVNCVKRWAAARILKYGARIKSFGGDAYLFECSRLDGETDKNLALRLARVLWTLAESQPELNRDLMLQGLPPLRFRFGGHMGPVTDVDLLDLGSNVTTIVGRHVNLVQRIQSIALPDQVLVSQELASLISDSFVLSRLSLSHLKGLRRSIDIYRIDGERSMAEVL